MSNGEESRMTFLMLPHDLVLNCLARVSKEYYPSLSLVCKKFRYILASTEFQELRSFLGCTGICLYVCLSIRYINRPIWFTLRQRPNSHSKILVQVSSPFEYKSGVAAVDSNIYAIGGSINDNALSSVMVMDCRSHTWSEAPSMHVARKVPSTSIVNGKVYVIGGCNNLDSSNWIEVFDTKTQTWEFLQIPSEEICRGSEYTSIGYEETVYVGSNEMYKTYKLHKGRWRAAPFAIMGHYLPECCVIKNVLYMCRYGTIRWYDSDYLRTWRSLKGLPRSFMNHQSGTVKLVDYGGNIAVLWEEYITPHGYKKQVWFAEIAIEKKRQGEIWGTLKWSQVVSTSDETVRILHAVSTSV